MSEKSEMLDVDIVDSDNQLTNGLPAESKEEKLLQEAMARMK